MHGFYVIGFIFFSINSVKTYKITKCPGQDCSIHGRYVQKLLFKTDPFFHRSLINRMFILPRSNIFFFLTKTKDHDTFKLNASFTATRMVLNYLSERVARSFCIVVYNTLRAIEMSATPSSSLE